MALWVPVSILPYTLEFEFEILRADRPNVLEGRARGELAGDGIWRIMRWGGEGLARHLGVRLLAAS